MIARVWRGEIRANQADEYIAYIERTGGGEYLRTPAIAAPGRCPAYTATEPRSSP
jgi:hypothetical protein